MRVRAIGRWAAAALGASARSRCAAPPVLPQPRRVPTGVGRPRQQRLGRVHPRQLLAGRGRALVVCTGDARTTQQQRRRISRHELVHATGIRHSTPAAIRSSGAGRWCGKAVGSASSVSMRVTTRRARAATRSSARPRPTSGSSAARRRSTPTTSPIRILRRTPKDRSRSVPCRRSRSGRSARPGSPAPVGARGTIHLDAPGTADQLGGTTLTYKWVLKGPREQGVHERGPR